jgi:hypothetical protein
MPTDLFRTFLAQLEVLRPLLRRAAFTKWVLVTVGWILTTEPRHSLAAALVAVGVAERLPFQPFYAFFARGAWTPDRLGLALLGQIARRFDGGPLRIVVDDTLNPHKGAHIFGLGCHVDPVLSTRAVKVLRFGLNWVVLAVVVRVPFSTRWWALPVLFRLYRAKKSCPRAAYRKKTELAHALVQGVCRAFPARLVVGTGDLGYCNGTVLRDRPVNLLWVGTMRPDAVLTALPTTARRTKGARLPTPADLAADRTRPWQTVCADLYGRVATVRYKTLVAQWYRVSGATALRIVVAKTTAGIIPFRVFFATLATLDPALVLETYASRWPIETFFEDARQWLGFGESAQRVAAAVLRITPFVGWTYTLLVLWFADGVWRSPVAQPPARRWYRTKTDQSFADIMRTARRVLAEADVLTAAQGYLRRPRDAPTPQVPRQLPLPFAA